MDANKAYAERGLIQILDVRSQDDWEIGHIERAHHIALEELADRLDAEVPTDRRIVVVDRLASRCDEAVQLLREADYDAEPMDGGLTAWEDAELPLAGD